jgi:PAS domain S-box-containing protein
MNPVTRSKKGFFINIVLPSALAVLLFTGTLFLIVIPSFENAMMDRKREMIMELTNAVTSILEKYHKDETDSLITREVAQSTAVSRIRYIRYGDEHKDYFWITDMQPVMVMHPWRPELIGQNLSDYKDPHGKKLFVESVKLAKDAGHGYIDYMWQWKDDSTHIVPKLSYIKAFKPWGWVIGTGIYTEDVRSEIASLTRKFIVISIIISLITALILFWVGRQSFRIENRRIEAEESLHESKEKYRSLVEASTEGLLMLVGGKITFANAIIRRMTGLSDAEMMKREPADLLELTDDFISRIENPDNEFVTTAFETNLFNAHGHKLSVLLNVSPVVFNGNDAIIFSIKELSLDQPLRDELLSNKEMFNALMDKLGIGVFRTTVDLRGKFLEANTTALNILGYRKMDELAGTYILEMFEDIEDKLSFRKDLFEQGFLKNQVIKLRRKNGQRAVVSISLVVVGDERAPRFCDGLIEDISYKTPEGTLSDSLLGEYNAFSVLFHQPVTSLMRPPVLIPYRTDAAGVANALSKGEGNAVLVQADGGEVLGIITRSDLMQRVIAGNLQERVSAFTIMTSPVITIPETATVLEAISLFRQFEPVEHLGVVNGEGAFTGMVDAVAMTELLRAFPTLTPFETGKARSAADLAAYHENFIESILPVAGVVNNPSVVFSSLTRISDAITLRIIEMVTTEMGQPPVPFCFFSLGSDARQEQSFSTDQDNALIFIDPVDGSQNQTYQYFRLFSEKVCTMLNEAGYQFCKGNVMAMNPEWCQPVSVWHGYFQKWINKANAKDLLDINIFFDIRPLYGETTLISDLQKHIFSLTAANPAYLYHLTQNTLVLKPQVGFWGNILPETAGAPPDTVNVKESIMPIVNFARIYALRHQINATGTIARLDALLKEHILKESSHENIKQAFEYLNLLRIKHQAYLLGNKLKPDNLISTKSFSDLDKTIIRKVISNINTMLTKLSYDFKGSM